MYYFGPYLIANRPGVAMPRIVSFLTSLRASTDDRIGVAGFCWGGKFSVMLCDSAAYSTKDGKSLIDCAFVAHPSNLSLPTEIEKATLPLRICQGSEDFVLKMDGVRQIEKIFAAKEEQLPQSQKASFSLRLSKGRGMALPFEGTWAFRRRSTTEWWQRMKPSSGFRNG